MFRSKNRFTRCHEKSGNEEQIHSTAGMLSNALFCNVRTANPELTRWRFSRCYVLCFRPTKLFETIETERNALLRFTRVILYTIS